MVSLLAAGTALITRLTVANGATLSGSVVTAAAPTWPLGRPLALACAADPAAAAVIVVAASAAAAMTRRAFFMVSLSLRKMIKSYCGK